MNREPALLIGAILATAELALAFLVDVGVVPELYRGPGAALLVGVAAIWTRSRVYAPETHRETLSAVYTAARAEADEEADR